MRVAVVYVFPTVNFRHYEKLAARFVAAYAKHPAGAEHELYVAVNGGGQITDRQRALFDSINPHYIYHNNVGRDIGAYQMAARGVPCDLLVCVGAPVRPCHIGWLAYMVAAVEDNGPGLYGCWAFHVPNPHLRTTLFWTAPEILNAYPEQIQNHRRYEFEFGKNSISQFCMRKGIPVLQVTRLGVFEQANWHHVEREDCLMLDQHCDNLKYT